ncbi:MAG: nitrogenase component 1 [Firmicutes bacterium]|nr:nitrogenase component 1 [Bacillota bacterium]
MTERSLKSISPDGVSGMIFAMEGMKNAVVLLNGPMGCRFYHSTTSRFLSVRPLMTLPAEKDGARTPVDYNYLNDFFFFQDRVPCTYLDGYDYVYGTRDKVRRALDFIQANIAFDFLAIVNSPGAALIGDNLLELAREKLGESRVVMLESPGYSTSFQEGYSEAALALLQQTGPALWAGRKKPGDGKKRVNLLGLSVWQRYMEGDLQELERLFALCGIQVNAALCAGCSLEQLRAMPDADLNVVLYAETGLAAAEYMAECWNIPYYVCQPPPIGFSATERMFAGICAILHADGAPLRAESERARALAWFWLDQIHQTYGRPKGVKYYVEGLPSRAAAFTAFLTDYLGMEPAGPDEAELVFGDANLIAGLKLKNKTFCGIETDRPGMGYVDLLPKTHLGIEGALFLIEQVLNGLMSKL